MTDTFISKRLHISGLTSAISADDLTRRLGSFGKVTALDGLGALDALGQQRKFAYATLETTPSQLQRCMTLLSGTTWKGAKLRIGEARPDYRERIALERDSEQRPSKRRRLLRGIHGVHAEDMAPLTREAAAARSGWRTFPSGRVVRVIRIRPTHPLPPPLLDAQDPRKTPKAGTKKPRKRAEAPPTRARRRTIDMTRWGSTQLKGAFLDSGLPTRVTVPVLHDVDDVGSNEDTSEEEGIVDKEEDDGTSEEEEVEENVDDEESGHVAAQPSTRLGASTGQMAQNALESSAVAARPTLVSQDTTSGSVETGSIAAEKARTLDFLHNLFGNNDDWGERESVDEAISTAGRVPVVSAAEAHDAIEEVPRTGKPSVSERQPTRSPTTGVRSVETVTEKEATAVTKPAGLKDLFAPREEEGGFSLLSHLDLDLELDEDPFAVPLAPEAPVVSLLSTAASTATALTRAPSAERTVLNPATTLFFPLTAAAAAHRGKRKRDPLSVARESGRHWRDCFVRTESESEMRARWEESKLELTRDWKRRHREAVKSRRRRGFGEAE